MLIQQIYESTDLKSGLTTLRRGQLRISFDPKSPTSIANALQSLGADGSAGALSLINYIQVRFR